MMSWANVAIVGASGGIGSALADMLEGEGAKVQRLGRKEGGDRYLDLLDEASIASAAEHLAGKSPLDLVVVATGYLHNDGEGPEKDWRQLSAKELSRSFAINAAGPTMIAKHFIPLLRDEGRAGFAALSARVGSISDNRLGGWYSYRASKAALNMLIRTLAVELARKKPETFIVGLHPGTVDTPLSKPFQRGVSGDKLFVPEFSASRMLAVLDLLGPEHSGRLYAWDGTEIAP